MKPLNKVISKNIISLNRYTKRAIAFLTDIILCIFTVWLAFFLRLEELILLKDNNLNVVFLSIILAIPIFWFLGLYRTLFRYAGLSILFTITLSIIIYGMLYFSIIGIYGIQGVPRSIGIIQPILLFIGVLCTRFGAKYILTGTFNHLGELKPKENILIYGAGSAGRQLLISLENNPKYKVAGFLDDNNQLHRQYLLGQKIYDPKKIEDLIKIKNIKLILIAIPSLNKTEKNLIIKKRICIIFQMEF